MTEGTVEGQNTEEAQTTEKRFPIKIVTQQGEHKAPPTQKATVTYEVALNRHQNKRRVDAYVQTLPPGERPKGT